MSVFKLGDVFLLSTHISWCLKAKSDCRQRDICLQYQSYCSLSFCQKKRKEITPLYQYFHQTLLTQQHFFSPNWIHCFLCIMRHFKWARPLCVNIIENVPLLFQLYPVDCNFTAAKYLGSSLLIQSTLGWEARTIGLQFTKADRLSVSVIPDATPPHLMGRFRLLNDSLLSVIQGAGIACLHVWIQNDLLRWASASEWM